MKLSYFGFFRDKYYDFGCFRVRPAISSFSGRSFLFSAFLGVRTTILAFSRRMSAIAAFEVKHSNVGLSKG